MTTRQLQAQAKPVQLHTPLLDWRGQREEAYPTLERTRADLGRGRGRITAMESSTFGMLRRAWFQAKSALRISAAE